MDECEHTHDSGSDAAVQMVVDQLTGVDWILTVAETCVGRIDAVDGEDSFVFLPAISRINGHVRRGRTRGRSLLRGRSPERADKTHRWSDT